MATIDDYGKSDVETLAQPKLGGTDGWAAAVAAKLHELVASVSDRVLKSGDTMTGNLDANGVVVGDVWNGAFSGIQHLAIGHQASAGLLLGLSDGTSTPTYLMGEPATGIIILRPAADGDGSTDVVIDINGAVTITGGDPTHASHAATKNYVDSRTPSKAYHLGVLATNANGHLEINVPAGVFSGTFHTVVTGNGSNVYAYIDNGGTATYQRLQVMYSTTDTIAPGVGVVATAFGWPG